MTVPDVIDLRSDTVTRPTPEMRQAMAECEVGDDVFGDDPTINRLQDLVAELVGCEASLWCATGTLANQVAINTHTIPGQEVIASEWSHIVLYELGGMAWNSGCQLRRISDTNGYPAPVEVASAIQEENNHMPGTGLLCLENTHNRRGGRIVPLNLLHECSALAHDKGLPVHLDGARIFNASVASGIPVSGYMSSVDSMMFCLSKGLASPAGSMLCGRRSFIDRAHRIRKRFGGALRQAGVLAACGIISVTKMVDRLADDHRAAKEIAGRILETGVLEIDPDAVDTNIVIFSLPRGLRGSALDLCNSCESNGLLITYMGTDLVRMVTHADYDPSWTDTVIDRLVKSVEDIA